MLLCYKLWLGERNFPLCPIYSWLQVPSFIHLVVFVGACILLACIATIRVPRGLITGFAILGTCMALLDENRWQPWFYQYVVMFFALASLDNTDENKKRTLNLLRFMMAAIYFWSGLNKLNPNFPNDTFPWLMEPITNHMSPGS